MGRPVRFGSRFVIGPLLKESIQQLAQSGFLPVPVLALNHSGTLPIDDALLKMRQSIRRLYGEEQKAAKAG